LDISRERNNIYRKVSRSINFSSLFYAFARSLFSTLHKKFNCSYCVPIGPQARRPKKREKPPLQSISRQSSLFQNTREKFGGKKIYFAKEGG
jgi:hypothetical protein